MRLSLDANDYNEDVNQAHVVPAWISLVDVIFVLILIPIMDKLVYPWLDKKGCSLSVFTRISTGKYIFCLCYSTGHTRMIISGCVGQPSHCAIYLASTYVQISTVINQSWT